MQVWNLLMATEASLLPLLCPSALSKHSQAEVSVTDSKCSYFGTEEFHCYYKVCSNSY